MEPTDALAHAISAGSGAGLVGWLSRQLHKTQNKRIEKMEKNVEKILDVVTRLDERVKTLQEKDRSVEHAIKLAVLEKDIEKAKGDLNGLGSKMREMSQL